MFYVTGDTHGNWTRFNKDCFPEQRDMTKSDYSLVLGDFGILNGSSEENRLLDWLESANFTTLFVSGNHDNYDILDSLKAEEWNGGLVHKIRPSIIHLMHGQVYNIDGRKIFTFGGARSQDISDGILEPDDPLLEEKMALLNKNPYSAYRVNHLSWWEREIPSKEEMETGIENLKKNHWKVDYIFTHCPPSNIQAVMGAGFYKRDVLTDYLNQIIEKCSFTAWLFGHMHVNRRILEKHYCLYEQFIRLW